MNWIIFVFYFCAVSLILSQDEFIKFQQIGSESGLSVSFIRDLVQDRQNFIWLATEDGLYRYDGYEFIVYRRTQTSKNSLTSNSINTIIIDSMNRIWIGSNAGLDMFRLDAHKIQNLSLQERWSSFNLSMINHLDIIQNNLWISSKNGIYILDLNSLELSKFDLPNLPKSDIHHVYAQNDNRLYISTATGLFQYTVDSKELTNISSKLPSTNVSRVYKTNNNTLWISTDAGLVIHELGTDNYYTQLKSPEWFRNFPKNAKVTDFAQDANGNLWLTTLNDGLLRYDADRNYFNRYVNDLINLNTPSSDQMLSVNIGSQGFIWVGTYGGGLNKIIHYDNKHFIQMSASTFFANTLNDNNITAIFEDIYGETWIGTANKGLNRYNPKKREMKYYTFNPNYSSISSNQITAIIDDNFDNLWIGTNDGLNRLDRVRGRNEIFRMSNSGLPSNKITALYFDSKNNVWIGTDNGLVKMNPKSQSMTKFYASDDSNKLIDNDVRVIAEDNAENIWIGTAAGLSRLQLSTNEFLNFNYSRTDSSSISDNSILSISIDKQSRIWIGTENGLNRYQSQSRNFKRYGLNDGFPNAVIYGVLQDKQNNLWLSTNNGLSRFHPDEGRIKNFTFNDGIPSNKFNKNSYYSRGERLYFGSSNGLLAFYPERIVSNTNMPLINITEIKLNYQNYIPDSGYYSLKDLELEYEFNTITVSVSAMDFMNSAGNQYEFKMDGIDANWLRTGRQRAITYSNLEPGSYILRINASNSDGLWQKNSKQLKITIIPPFWKATWFRTLVILFVIGIVVLVFYVNSRNAKQREEILDRQVEARTKELMQASKKLQKAYEDLIEENAQRKIAEELLLEARKETDTILQNVNEGLFLLNSDSLVSEQHSSALENIFEMKNISKLNLIDILRPHITLKVLEALEDFLELLFNVDIDEEVVLELNPLSDCELHFEKENSKFSIKYLEFAFSRVYKGDDIINLLVTVRDMTKLHFLKKQLEESENQKKFEMEQLFSILSIEPNILRNFLKLVEIGLQDISKTFEEDKMDYTSTLLEAFKTIHNLKGNAGLINLNYYVDRFHNIEEIIKALQPRKRLTGDDFISIILEVRKINVYTDQMNGLLDRIIEMSDKLRNEEQGFNENDLMHELNKLIHNLGEKLGKRAKIVFQNNAKIEIPKDMNEILQDIIVHLVRNSMVHGVERIEDRLKMNKVPEATISLVFSGDNGALNINYRDDGRGLDIDKIKDKAVKSGKISKTDADNLKNSEYAKLIFAEGFTTAEEAGEEAGRGYGMSIIKDIVTKRKGKIKFSYSKNKYFELGIEIPLA